jgi:hypothetical protein
MNKQQLFDKILREAYVSDEEKASYKSKWDNFVKKVVYILKDNAEEWGQEVTWEELGGKAHVIRAAKDFVNICTMIFKNNDEDKMDQYNFAVEQLQDEVPGKYDNPPGLIEAVEEYFGKDALTNKRPPSRSHNY